MDIPQFELHAKLEDIHWWFKARREIIFEILKRHVPPGKRKIIAEIGCGTGGNLKFLREYYQLIGVDTSSEAVKYAMERVDCNVFLGDFRDVLSNKWNHLDAVLLLDVLEHIDDDVNFINDIVKNLNPNAILLITVPAHMCLWSQHDVVLGHKRRYSAGKLRSLWKNSDVVKELFFSSFNTFLFPAIALLRILKKTKNVRKSDLFMPPPLINCLLYKIFSIERIMLKLFTIPFGMSYLVVLKKSET
jgi:SAM-dependent methyltransferase